MRSTLACLFVFVPLASFGGHKEIPTAYITMSLSRNIPPDIVYSVALAESGYTNNSVFNPWPWSLNIEGKEYRFASRSKAFEALKEAVSKGYSVDIGIMQVNWYWHKERFRDLWSSLDPYTNLLVGIDILIEHYRTTKKWWLAVGHYHAPGNSKVSKIRAEKYRQRVHQQWQKVKPYKVSS